MIGAYTNATLWSAIEPAVALVSVCLPSLTFLCKLWWRRSQRSRRHDLWGSRGRSRRRAVHDQPLPAGAVPSAPALNLKPGAEYAGATDRETEGLDLPANAQRMWMPYPSQVTLQGRSVGRMF